MDKRAAARIAQALRPVRRLLITAHQDPDGDSLGCQLAFHEYWTKQKKRKADIINHGGLPSKYRFMDPKLLVKDPNGTQKWPNWDAAIIFECGSAARTGDVAKLIPGDKPLINIDHHLRNEFYGTINVIDTRRAACGELLYDLLKLSRARITPSIASFLAIAIITDTGRFHYPSTTERTLAIAGELVRHGADLSELTDRIYFRMGEPLFRLTHHVVNQARLRANGTLCMLLLRQGDLEKFGVPLRDTEGLVDYSLSINGVKVGALLKELGDQKTKISLRSPDSIDVAKLARKHGGGGHKNAAGFIVEMPIDAAAEFLEREVTR